MDDFLKDLRDRKRVLKQQLEQLNAAERAYRAAAIAVRNGLAVPTRKQNRGTYNGLARHAQQSINKTPTIKQSVMKLLEDYPNGLTALQMLEKLQKTVRPELQRHILSPQLSRLRQAGRLSHNGQVWSLSQPTLLKQGGDDDAIV